MNVSTTANIGFTRSSFDLVEGFNEDLSYGSDADFIWKLEKQGIQHICVESAIMGLNGGSTHRELKRNWLYGKASVTLFGLHPSKAIKKFKFIWVYSLLITMWFWALMLVLKNPFVVLFPLITTCILVLKNIREAHPLRVILRHYIYGAGTIYQIIARIWDRRKLSSALLFPSGSDKYTHKLRRSINQSHNIVQDFPRLGPLATIGILLLPFFSLIIKIRGARIVHIHWLYSFNLNWAHGKISRIFTQYWFYLWIISLKICKIKIVYTVHNILPHEKIFNNDKKVFQFLEKHANNLILLNESSFESYDQLYPRKVLHLIPEGPLLMPTTIKRIEQRDRLQVAESKRLIVLVGYLRPYKGLSSLLEGAVDLPKNFAIRVAGSADDKYQKELELTLLHLKSQNIDIDIAFRRLTDNEYGAYLNAADFICLPFKEINNSGSINSALCAGVPVIVPNISSLDWVPKGAILNIPNNSDGNFDFKELFQLIMQISVPEYDSMKESALEWVTKLSWQNVAKKHINLYRELSGKDE